MLSSSVAQRRDHLGGEMIRNHARARVDAGRTADSGFSLIELLVVVVVLGVLAAIAVPSYLGFQNEAKDAAVQTDLGNAKKALTAFGTDHDGNLPSTVVRSGAGTYGAVPVDLGRYGWTAGPNTASLTFSRSGDSWCVLGASSTGTAFAVSSRSAVVRSASCPA